MSSNTLLVLGVLNLMIFVLVIRRWAYRSAKIHLQKRHNIIASDIREANTKQKDAKKNLKISKETLKGIDNEIAVIKKVAQEAAAYEEWTEIDKGENEASKIHENMDRYLDHEIKLSLIKLKKETLKDALEETYRNLSQGLDKKERKKQMLNALEYFEGISSFNLNKISTMAIGHNFKVSIRYAEAFYGICSEKGIVEEGMKFLEKVVERISTKSELGRALTNESLKRQMRMEILCSIVDKISEKEEFKNFIYYLFDKDRISIIGEIRDLYRSFYNNDLKVCHVEMVVVKKEDADIIEEKVVNKISEMTKSKVHMKMVCDPSIIGGMKVKIGDKIFDCTVQGRINDMKEKMLGGM